MLPVRCLALWRAQNGETPQKGSQQKMPGIPILC